MTISGQLPAPPFAMYAQRFSHHACAAHQERLVEKCRAPHYSLKIWRERRKTRSIPSNERQIESCATATSKQQDVYESTQSERTVNTCNKFGAVPYRSRHAIEVSFCAIEAPLRYNNLVEFKVSRAALHAQAHSTSGRRRLVACIHQVRSTRRPGPNGWKPQFF